jgi:predicted TIM-barrel fold metal-dependent hydrolase
LSKEGIVATAAKQKVQYRCISADSHVNVHPNVYAERVPAQFKDKAPRVEFTPEGDYWVFEGKRSPAIGLGHQAGKKWEDYKTAGQGGKFEETRPGSWDPVERIKDMALDGVDAQVLYSGHFGGQASDLELRLVLLQAYHDWLHEFCSYAPERFRGVAMFPGWDLEVGLKEAERVIKLGTYGNIGIPAFCPEPNGQYGKSAGWDRMFSMIEESGLFASMHLGGGGRTTMESNPMGMIANATISCAEPFGVMLYNGVLEKHPKLRVISAETGFGWWPYFMDRLDTVYRRHRWWTKSTLPHEPSYYVKRNVWITFQEDRAGMRLVDFIGEDRVMWADDYPHTDSTWPNSQKFLDEHFQLVPEKDRERLRRKISCENAGKLYGWVT